MIYEYKCTKCGNVQDESCSVKVFEEFKPPCNKCGEECNYQFAPTKIQFILKDGPSGSWPSKGNRYKQHRAEASAAASKRQKERYKENRLVPNFEGKETESWAEAREYAVQKKGLESAATYDAKVATELKK
jgi:hypothetical protein